MESIKDLADYIIQKEKKRVLLQFSNKQIDKSFEMKNNLSKLCEHAEFFIAADNTKNECCCDIKAAKTIEADIIVKIGFSCLFDELNKIDIVYFYEKSKIEFDFLGMLENNKIEKDSFLFMDQNYEYLLNSENMEKIKKMGINIICSKDKLIKLKEKPEYFYMRRYSSKKIEKLSDIYFFGDDDSKIKTYLFFSKKNLKIQNLKKIIFEKKTFEEINQNDRLILQRFNTIYKAK